jgi:hypothetical protein
VEEVLIERLLQQTVQVVLEDGVVEILIHKKIEIELFDKIKFDLNNYNLHNPSEKSDLLCSCPWCARD